MISLTLAGQENLISRNNIYLEAGGAAFFYSFNYERLLFNNPHQNVTARVGFLYLPTLNAAKRNFKGIPISASYIIRKRKYFMETGISMAAIIDEYDLNFESNTFDSHVKELVLIPSFRLGMRRQPQIKGFFWNLLFQVSYVTVDDYDNFQFGTAEKNFIPYLSAGIGHAF